MKVLNAHSKLTTSQKVSFKSLKSRCAETLLSKYRTKFFFFMAKSINEVLNDCRSSSLICYREERILGSVEDSLKRFYKALESKIRISKRRLNGTQLANPFPPTVNCFKL